MILSLKVSYVLHQTISKLCYADEISYVLDFEESEKEEKKELDEEKKINQKNTLSCFFNHKKSTKKTANISFKYKDIYEEFVTPPPEVIS